MGKERGKKPQQIETSNQKIEYAYRCLDLLQGIVATAAGSKRPVLKGWNSGGAFQTRAQIKDHFTKHPNHDLAGLIGSRYVVFDIDAEEGDREFNRLREGFGIGETLTVKTKRGTHYHYRVRPSKFVKTRNYDSAKSPEKIDMKAEGSLINLPPREGYSCANLDKFTCPSDLPEVPIEFVKAVLRHNGDNPDRPKSKFERSGNRDTGVPAAGIRKCLEFIDPDVGYDEWLRVGLAIHNSSGGSIWGFKLWNRWSRDGKKYKGKQELSSKWKGFSRGDCS